MTKKNKRQSNYIDSGRVLVKFNTGTQPHKSSKDYSRKKKHKLLEETKWPYSYQHLYFYLL